MQWRLLHVSGYQSIPFIAVHLCICLIRRQDRGKKGEELNSGNMSARSCSLDMHILIMKESKFVYLLDLGIPLKQELPPFDKFS